MKEKIQAAWRLLERFLHFLAFDLLKLKLTQKQWDAFMQFVRFGFVGLSNTLVSYTIYALSLLFFQKQGWLPRTDYLVAHLLAFALSVLWSFYWNRKFVFHADRQEGSWAAQLLRTYISYAFTGLFLNSLLSILWVEVVGIPKLAAPIFNLLISVPLNFVLNKFWAFKKKA